jgi:transcriptional regulator with XRE-family HTH domain
MTNLIKPTDGDSTEFYTVEETGESGMSQTGLAKLCGVSQQAVSNLEKTLTSRAPSKWLETFVGQDLTLTSSAKDPTLTVNSIKAGNISIYRSTFCARVIQHYAFQGNEVAQYSLDQFTDLGISQWIQGITGWKQEPIRSYIPYWYQRLTLFTAKTRIPDGWWSVFEELAKLMRELEGLGYVLPDVSPTTGKPITPDISIGQMFCKHMRAQGHDVDGEIEKYLHYYPDGREIFANIYPDKWLQEFRSWFNSVWKKDRLINYLGSRDPDALTPISRLLGLPEGEDD